MAGPQKLFINETKNDQNDIFGVNEITAFKRIAWQEQVFPVLNLLPLNGTFDKKSILVPYYPYSHLIGRQMDSITVPTSMNGIFDAKVVSRKHAEIWASRDGRVWIRDTRSSNGTFVNGTRLSPEDLESEPHELSNQDRLQFATDIVDEGQKGLYSTELPQRLNTLGIQN